MKALILALGCLSAGCELWGGEMPDPECRSVEVEPKAELILSDLSVRRDVRALNAPAGVWSFAGQLDTLGIRVGGLDDSELWAVIGGPRPPASETPFRLLAIVNRADLGQQLAPEGPAGEARLVYTLTNGRGDDPQAKALPLTLIFEYRLSGDARSWAERFHALTDFGLEDERRLEALGALVEELQLELSQIRINDARSGTALVHELALVGTKLIRRGLRNTPRLELAGTPLLARYLSDNAEAIVAGHHRVPDGWLAERAEVGVIDWRAAETPADVGHEFERGTCSGCHSDPGGGKGGFHLAEDELGQVVFSPFLLDGEIERRRRVQQQLLCAPEG